MSPVLTAQRAPLLKPLVAWERTLPVLAPANGRIFAGSFPKGSEAHGLSIAVSRQGGGAQWPFDQAVLDHICRSDDGHLSEDAAQRVVAAFESVAYPLGIGSDIQLELLESWTIAEMPKLVGWRYRATVVVWVRPLRVL